MRRPPKRRQPATVNQNTTLRRGNKGEVLHEESKVDAEYVGVEAGKSGISVAHDTKLWASEETGGITVGCVVQVSLTCDQKISALEKANDAASKLALRFLRKNMGEAQEMIEEFRG